MHSHYNKIINYHIKIKEQFVVDNVKDKDRNIYLIQIIIIYTIIHIQILTQIHIIYIIIIEQIFKIF